MAKEGIEVIQANNRRVAAAKKAAAETEINLENAKKAGDVAQKALEKGLEHAKNLVDIAKKTIEVRTKKHAEAVEELKDAEKSQEAAQKKWEVVDLAEEDEEKPKSSSVSKKRAEASSDSEVNANKKGRSDGAEKSIEVARKEHDEASEEVKDAEQSQQAAQKKWEVVDLVEDDKLKSSNGSSSTKRAGESSDLKVNTSKKVKSDSVIPEEITVEGCGISEINGTYGRDRDYNGATMYSKKGQWKGHDVTFDVCRSSFFNSWIIYCRLQPQGNGYFYCQGDKTSVPPSDGWWVSRDGVKPPPKIT